MSDALLVLSRYPRLGKVKTRLSKTLSHAACLELHQAFLLDTLDRIATLQVVPHLFLSDCSDAEVREFSRFHSFPSTLCAHLQEGRDLGERMWNAYQKIYVPCDRVLFVGVDSPSLPLAWIEEALGRLDDFPVVAGPAEDGGYYLLGLSEPRRELFYNIMWGTSLVLEQTLSKLDVEEYCLLPPWYDVDKESDLCRLKEDLNKNFEGFPRRTSTSLRNLSRELHFSS